MNDKGFSMLSISFLIPILFFGCLLVVGSYQLISKYTDLQRECRSGVLGAQKILGQKLQELMDLNPQARTLRTEAKNLRLAIKIALVSNPSGVPALMQLLQINLTKQGILRGQQEKILSSAVVQGKKILAQYNHLHTSNIALKVLKIPPTAISPDHQPMPFFREVQTIKANWRVPIDEILPFDFLKLYPKGYPNTVQGKCSATLVRKGEVWNPKLHLAKF